MNYFELYVSSGAVLVILTSLLWLISLRLRNSSIIDIFWGLGFVVSSGVFFALADGLRTRQLLLTGIVTLWGLRLSVYLFWRNAGKGEDYRYTAMRDRAGESWWWRSYFQVFLLQGVLILLISSPLLAAHKSTQPLSILDWAGIAVWLIGFFFESVGDLQLARFKSNPANKGQVLNTGLWRYTRHPNYFGDAVVWWGYYLIALSAGAFWTIFAPVIMTLLLMKVSGVALLEKTLVSTKEGYEEYVSTTSAFFPRPPRQSN